MKKIKILFAIASFFIGINAYAVTTIPRTEEDLGVSKNCNITSANKDNVLRTPRVDVSEKIYDFAEVIPDEEEAELRNQINDYIETSNMDMVVITTDLAYSDSEIEDYAADFYDYNDFGLNFENYSGILLIRNVNDYNRYFNIYTFGEAQLYYPYERCENILDDIYDDIHEERYLSGITTFIDRASSYYKSGIPKQYQDYTIGENGKLIKPYKIPFLLCGGISFVVTLIVMLILIKKNRMVKKETNANAYLNKNSVNYTRMEDIFMHSHTSSYTISSDSGSGGGSHMGSSGGFHGGGGGRHG